MGCGAARGTIEAASAAIDALTPAADHDELLAVLALRDRLDAALTDAVARFDAAELWADDGATSMTRWLVTEARLDDPAAHRLVRRAQRLDRWPVLAHAYATGTISAGQVAIVTTRVAPRHVALFGDHEAALVPALTALGVDDTATVLREWSDRADALLDTEPSEPERSTLHLARIGDRGRLDADLDSDATAIVAEALRLARRHDDDTDDGRRTRAERDADALVDICRRLLRDHDTPAAAPGRQRPGVNVVIDAAQLAALELRQLGVRDQPTLDELLAEPTTPAQRAWYQAGLQALHGRTAAAARTLTGHDLSPALAAAFHCDATMRRVLTAASTVLDHGRALPTIPQAIRDVVVLRDRHCRFPGCQRGVDWCEVHHVRRRIDGGPDAVTNCVLLCAYHHHVLHRDGWSAHLADDGTLVVACPRGRHRTTRPPGPANGPPPSTGPLTFGA